jgi:hypothetical protein
MQSWEFSANPPFDVTSFEAKGDATNWELLKHQLFLGTILSGKIFARTYFGVFFDAGQGFPVRMNITDFGQPEGNMKWPDDYPALDTEISGVFNAFDEHHYQLVVIRLGLKPHSHISPVRRHIGSNPSFFRFSRPHQGGIR